MPGWTDGCRLQRATSKAVQYRYSTLRDNAGRRAPLRVSVTQLTEIQTTGYYLVHLLMCDKCAHRDQRSLRVNDLKLSGYLRRGAWTVWVVGTGVGRAAALPRRSFSSAARRPTADRQHRRSSAITRWPQRFALNAWSWARLARVGRDTVQATAT